MRNPSITLNRRIMVIVSPSFRCWRLWKSVISSDQSDCRFRTVKAAMRNEKVRAMTSIIQFTTPLPPTQYGDWFLVSQIQKNTDSAMFDEFMELLAQEEDDKVV